MNVGRCNGKPNAYDHYVPPSHTLDDDAACSVTLEPSLTNSSISINSASTSSSQRDNDCDRETSVLLFPPARLRTQSSLLDIDVDESFPEDEDIPIDNDMLLHSSAVSIDKPVESETTSFMEQTESSLANISETITGSFCTPMEINNSCHVSDCCLSTDQIEPNKGLYRDQIVRNRLEEDINYLLGTDVAPCCEERNLFCSFSAPPRREKGFEVEIGNKIRNRAGESWRARAYRIKRLRESRNLHDRSNFLGTDKIEGIQRSRSLDGPCHKDKMGHSSSANLHQSQRNRARRLKPKHEVNADPLGCIIGDCIEPILNVEGEENELEVVWKQQHDDVLSGEDLCYDSDPGESSKRDLIGSIEQHSYGDDDRNNGNIELQIEEGETTSNTRPSSIPSKRRRRMHFDSILELNSDDDSCHNDYIDEDINYNETHSSLTECNDSSPNRHDANEIQESNDESMFWDGGSSMLYSNNNTVSGLERDMIQNIQDALNRTWTLTWHPTSGDFETKAKSDSFRSPLRTIQINKKQESNVVAMPPRCIQLWFERGNRIRRNDIVEPKLMWREAYHPDLASKRKLNLSSTHGPHQVCLLSVCRILEATNTVDRKKYPFAKISCSFIIRTSDESEYVFEARSSGIRETILKQWKLVIARLASQAVVGDGEGMVREFFVPTSFSVP